MSTEVTSPVLSVDRIPARTGMEAAHRTGPSPALKRDMLFRRLLGVADATSVSLALIIGTFVASDAHLRVPALLAPPLIVAMAKALGLYERDQHLIHKTTLDEVPTIFGLATLASLLFALSGTLMSSSDPTRTQVVVLWSLFLLAMIATRSLARLIARSIAPAERCLVVGDAGDAEAIQAKLASSRAVNAELVGWLPFDRSPDEAAGRERQEISERVRAVIGERAVERVILGPGLGHSEGVLDSIRRIKDDGLKVSVLPDVFRVVSSSIELDRLNGLTLLGVRRFEFTRSSRIVKRTFDLVGGTVALILSTPILAVAAIAIKIDSRGPVFFRQQRAGRHGRPFAMLKLRSMVADAEARIEDLRELNEAEGVFKIADDPRITRVGKVLRKLYIDEIPQLVNVVRGEMSLVGPRPLPLAEDKRIEGWHRRRLDLAPGMTGPWQILGSSRIPVREMVYLDYHYVADWSLWNDIRILLLTVGHVARARGL